MQPADLALPTWTTAAATTNEKKASALAHHTAFIACSCSTVHRTRPLVTRHRWPDTSGGAPHFAVWFPTFVGRFQQRSPEAAARRNRQDSRPARRDGCAVTRPRAELLMTKIGEPAA